MAAATERKFPTWLRIFLPAILIVGWLTISGIGGPYFGKISEVSTNNLSDFLPNSSESTKVQERSKDFTSSNSIPAIAIFSRSGELTTADQAYLASVSTKLDTLDGIDKDLISPVIPSEDGKAAEIIIPISQDAEVRDVVKELRSELGRSGPEGLNHYVAGPAGFSADLSAAFGGIDGILLAVALAVVFVILLIVYRSPALPFIVLLTSMVALTASILVVYWFADNDIIRINGQVQGILFILVIGAATDYSLLYVARYREELRRTTDKTVATVQALKGSLEPIIASGSTVIVGLMCLLLSDLDSNKALGPVGGIGVAFSVFASLTFLPAMLYAVGRKVFWPAQPKFDKALAVHKADLSPGFWTKVAHFVDRNARPVWLVSFASLAVMAAWAVNFKAEGIEQTDFISGYSESREGQKEISKHFPSGTGSPALIVGDAEKLDLLVEKIVATNGVDSVVAVSKESPSGSVPVGTEAVTAGPFAAFKPTVVGGDVMLRATLVDVPDSVEAEQTVVTLRNELKKIDAEALVGGSTATSYDTTQASIRDRTIIVPAILGAILFILIILLRSLVAPILLIVSTALSFAATLGVSAVLFNGVLGLPGADASVPLYGFVFLVALGIDYNIFLMTRVREETLKHGTREGTIRGLAVTGGVITSAGTVLAATFAALSVIPILFLLQLAFIVAFGVLLDTLIVRSLLVPALIIDLDRWSWWPSKLSRK
jgi:RND superfamily putative drug exporter